MTVPEVAALLEQVEREMKTYDFGVSMGQRKLNSSFTLLAVQALRSYLLGELRSRRHFHGENGGD